MNDSRQRLSVSDYVDGVLNCDRALLAQAITLIESLNDDHRATADAVLNELLIQKQDSICTKIDIGQTRRWAKPLGPRWWWANVVGVGRGYGQGQCPASRFGHFEKIRRDV